jgi:hypothetical protein
MSNALPAPTVAIDQKSSDVATATKQIKSDISVLPLQLVAVHVIMIAVGWGKDDGAVGTGSRLSRFPCRTTTLYAPIR